MLPLERDVLHIITDLIESIFRSDLILGGALQLHQNQRKAIDKQDHIRTPVVAIFKERELIDHIESVILRLAIINQADNLIF